MIQILAKIKLEKEAITAICLIALFSAFLLINFTLGFNLFFYIIIALAGLILSFIYPRGGLYALIALTLIFAKFFTLQSFWINEVEYKLYLADIIMLGMLFSIWLSLVGRKIKLQLKLADVLLACFMALTAVYFLISIFYLDGDFLTAFSSFKNYIFYPLLYFATLFLIDSKEQLQRFFKFIIFGSIIIIPFIIYGLIVGQGLWTYITPLSTQGSRILDFDHAFYLCLISLAGLSYILFKKTKLNQLWYILLPIFAIGIAGSLMRHLWIAMFAALIFLYIIICKEHKEIFRKLIAKYIAAAVMILSVIILLINLFPFASFSQDMLETQDRLVNRAVSVVDASDSSIAWRSTVWKGVWKEYKDNIFLGLGFGQKIFIDMGYYRDYVEVRNIHNSWLAVFVQTGILGFIILISFYFNLIKNVFKQKAKDINLSVLRLAGLGIAVFCLIAFLFQPYLEANFFNIIFWINLGLMRRFYEGFAS
ncbi:MAG: O-antigen ligase family protein [bacterium]